MKGFAILPVVLGMIILALAVLALSRQGGSLSNVAQTVADQTQLDNLLDAARVHADWELDSRQCGGYMSVAAGLGSSSYSAAFSDNHGSPVDLTLSATLPDGTTQTRQLTQHAAFDVANTVQIVVSKAARVDENNAGSNYGNQHDLLIGDTATKKNRSLLQIDLASVPTGVRITRAWLRLKVENVGQIGSQMEVLRVIEPWQEDKVTWNNRDVQLLIVGVPWRNAGVTTAPESYGNVPINTAGEIGVDITELVTLWYESRVPNDGLLLHIPAAVTKPVTRISSEDAAVGNIALDVTYRCPCGSACSVSTYVSCDSNFRANTQSFQHGPGLANISAAAAVPANTTVAGLTFGIDGGRILADGTNLRGYSPAGQLLGSCAIGHSFSGLTYVSAGDDRGRLAGIKAQSTPQLVYMGTTCAVQRVQNVTAPTLNDPVGVAYLRLPLGTAREHQLAMVNATGLIEFVDAAGIVKGTVIPDYSPTTVGDIAQVHNQERLLLLDRGAAEVITASLSGTVEDRYDYSQFGVTNPEGLTIDMTSCAHVIASSTSNKVIDLSRTPLSLEPLAHWKLDETSGAIAIDSVGGHDASVVGTPVWQPAGGALQGALLLDSTGDGLQVVDSDALNLSEALTLSGWIKPDSNTGDDPIVSRKPDAVTHQYWLGTVNGVPAFLFNDNDEQQLTGSSVLSTGDWHHLAATFEMTTRQARLYVDGGEVANMPLPRMLKASLAPVRLGDDGVSRVEGHVDDVRIFSGALSAPDITILFGESPIGSTGGGTPPPPTCTTQSLADNFDSVSFGRSTGSRNWPDPWLEVGESDGANAGDIRVQTSPRALQLQDNDNGGEGVRRLVDLSQFTSATLTFDYARFGMDSGDYITVDIGDGTAWTELGRIVGPGNDSTSSMLPERYSLDSHLQANRYLRFRTYSGMGDTEGAYIDNFVISGCAP